jgi:hypothetical protein
MAEGEEQEDKEEEDKEKREKRKERAAKRRAPTEKRKRPQTTRRIFHFLLLNTCGRRARKKNRIPTHEMHFSSTLSQKQTKNRKTKTKTKKQRGGAKKTKKGARVQHHDDGVEELFNDYHETREEEHASRSVVRVGRVDVRVRWCNEGQRSRRESFKDGTAETLGATFEKFDIVGEPGVECCD